MLKNLTIALLLVCTQVGLCEAACGCGGTPASTENPDTKAETKSTDKNEEAKKS